MSIIIRLQNLPLSAKASDIREFFGDLKIPKGAVNIVGGLNGDAFIGFASDEDARLAMRHDGELLHNCKIRLMLSSRCEMDSTITNAHALAATTLNNKVTETKLKVPQSNIEPIKQQSVNINDNKQVTNDEQLFEQAVPTYPVNESWKNGIYSTNKEKIANNQPNILQPISGFGITSDNDSTTSYNSPQYLQNSKKNIYCQDDSYFTNTFKTNGKNLDAPNVPASTSNIVQEVNGYSGTMTQHSYQQHFDSQPSLLPNGYSEPYSKSYSQNLSYQEGGKLQHDLSNFNANDGSLVFNHNITQPINEGIKSNLNINSLRATNVPDQNIFNFSSMSANRNSASLKSDMYSENNIPSDIYQNQQSANAPVFPVTAPISNFSSRNSESINNQIKPPTFSNFGKINKNISEPPRMILEAATEDEMITRGELPATAFGAFSSNVAFGEKFIRRDGQAVSIAKDPFGRKSNTESFFNTNVPSTTKNSTNNYNRKMNNNHRVLLLPPENLKSNYNKMPYRNKRPYENMNGLNNTKPVSLLSLKFDSNAEDGSIPYDSWKSSSRSYKPLYPKRQMRKTDRSNYAQVSDKLPQSSPVDTSSES